MKRSRYTESTATGVDFKKNKSLARISLSLGVMEYLNKSTRKTADDLYNVVERGMKYVG